MATAHRATRFMVTLAAWQIVVRALTQEDDLVVVSPTAGRQQPQTHGLVGFFVNSVFLRTRVDGGATFEQLIDATRNTCIDALDHADIPFEAIVEATGRGRDIKSAAFAQVAFALQNAPGGCVQIDDLAISIAALETKTAKTDLALMLDEPGSGLNADVAEGLSGVLEFATDLFDRSTAKTIALAFEQVLEAACARPSLTVDALAADLNVPVKASLAVSLPSVETGLVGAQRDKSNLSDNQLLVWAGQQLDPNSPFHNIAVAIDIEQPIDFKSCETALKALVRSADAMRSAIVVQDGVPRLEVRDHLDGGAEYFDFSDLASSEAEQRVREICFAPLDLAERTFRFAVIRRNGARHTVLFVQHQIVSDMESIKIFFQVLSELYQGICSGSSPMRVEMPSYVDFLDEERRLRDTDSL
ncbi:MAG: condensation domain-containing protein, partial [Myxococcota bacterium]